MTESLNGLRFDIYERVQLPADTAAIDQLEEIELVPHMQTIAQDDHVLLKGHLLLTGVYRSQEDPALSRDFEHWIPVEISLPLSRVQSHDDLAVEIDNFDVDVLSDRSLNVTGVLSLRGLQVSAPQAPVWNEDGFTVVHQAPAFAPEPSAPTARPQEGGSTDAYPAQTAYGGPAVSPRETDASDRENAAPPDPDFGQSPPAQTDAYRERQAYSPEGYVQPTSSSSDAYRQAWRIGEDGEHSAFGRSEDEEFQANHGSENQTLAPGLNAEPESEREEEPFSAPSAPAKADEHAWQDDGEAAHAEFQPPQKDALPAWPESASPSAQPQQEPRPPEKREPPRVALGAKAANAANAANAGHTEPASGLGILAQLGDKNSKKEEAPRIPEPPTQPAAPPAEAKAAETGDEIEWTRFFLAKGGEEQSFRKLKLCIVQRDDTLETIAVRYNVQPRELQLYNRLSEPHVVEGQVLHIP